MYEVPAADELAVWIAAVRANPSAYSLPSYELRAPRVTLERAGAMFATWYRDEINPDHPSPALCRRCGRIFDRDDRDGRQVHIRCRYPIPEGMPEPRGWRW